jgi:hypothetical protein
MTNLRKPSAEARLFAAQYTGHGRREACVMCEECFRLADALDAFAEAEREACAKVADSWSGRPGFGDDPANQQIAARIRARGTQGGEHG